MGLALPFLLAYLLDLLLGDPPGWPHPVRLLGSIIKYWETVLYRTRVGAGALFWLAVMATTGVLILGVLGVAALLPPWGGIAVLAYFLYTGLATRSLHQESLKVEAALVRGDLDEAKASLSMIVGRETSHLSLEDMRRALREKEALIYCRERVTERALAMKLVAADQSLDGRKVTFYFTSEGRVDFRELVKDLAQKFHTRIEMRQIGVRDEAGVKGGYGPCGRNLCCSSFLKEFAPVSIRMAKDQNLSLNPSKISGMCGRLMCCLRYEHSPREGQAGAEPSSA